MKRCYYLSFLLIPFEIFMRGDFSCQRFARIIENNNRLANFDNLSDEEKQKFSLK